MKMFNTVKFDFTKTPGAIGKRIRFKEQTVIPSRSDSFSKMCFQRLCYR